MPLDISPQFGSLLGTLDAQGVLGLLEAQQQQSQQQLEQQAGQASRDAASAANSYSSLASAPPPSAGYSNFIPSLFSGVGSVLSGNPDYQREEANRETQAQSDRMEARKNNLEALQQIHAHKAQAAEKLGDLATAEKARLAQERIAKQLDQIRAESAQKNELEKQKRQNEFVGGQNALDRASAEKIAGIRAGQTRADAVAEQQQALKDLENTTRSGRTWVDMSTLSPKEKTVARAYAAKNGFTAVDKGTADRLRTSEEVYQSFDDLESMLPNLLAKTPAERLIKGPENLAAAATQSNSDAAAFGNTQLLAIRNIQALAAGIGSGFRLNEQEIKRAVKNFPKLTDDLPTAQRKLQWERTFLQNKERAYLERDFRKKGGTVPTPAAAPSSSIQPTAADDAYVKSLGL